MRTQTKLCSLFALAVLASAGAVVAGDGVVALQTAAPSCRTTTTPPPRYVDCGNGTVTDNLTGLVWLKDANCFDLMNFTQAMQVVLGLSPYFDNCGLTDGSSPGEWRLPSAEELITMTQAARDLNCTGAFAPSITNDAGTHCWLQGVGANSFQNVAVSWYWTATNSPDIAVVIPLDDFPAAGADKSSLAYVWPVRSGQ